MVCSLLTDLLCGAVHSVRFLSCCMHWDNWELYLSDKALLFVVYSAVPRSFSWEPSSANSLPSGYPTGSSSPDTHISARGGWVCETQLCHLWEYGFIVVLLVALTSSVYIFLCEKMIQELKKNLNELQEKQIKD